MRWQMMFDKVSHSGDIKDKVTSKFAKLETYLGRMKSRVESGFIKLSKGERWGFKVKAIFRLPGKEIIAEGKSKTLLSAIDDATAKATREVRGYLEKIKEKKRA
ncbi:MAG: HPF/RaiA family ribosome-associated protein [bacterium]